MTTTWVQLMAQVRLLDEQRRREGHLNERDADRLVTMMLDFHHQVVVRTFSGEIPAASVRNNKPTGS